jgi:protein kinase-like protein/WD40 repeat protein
VILGTASELADALRDRYVIERELGRGGMATVYLAHDLKHDRDVALKVFRPELAAVLGRERFLAEIRMTAKLDHPHILTLIDSGQSDGFLWYVVPFIRGESLRQKLSREKQLGVEDALTITKQVAAALDYAHGQGVIHRDLKPENILLHEGEAMLADFGIALAVREAAGNRLTETGLSLGTPQYMSPEQATGDRQLDARSDVYSLASVLYEMLAGEPPVTGSTVQAVIAKLLTERPTSLRVLRDTLPQGVEAAVAKALAKAPADRFAGAGDFVEALDRASRSQFRTPGRRAHRVWMSVLAVAVLVAVSALAMRLARSPASDTFVVRDRSQFTFTGNATSPAISGDGKQLAYVVKHCSGSECTSGIEVQDIGADASRRAVVNVPRADDLRWSFDRRFLSFRGEIGGRWGTYIVPTLGGSPRLVAPQYCSATFHPAGDSLLIPSPNRRPDTTGWMAIATLSGDRKDSIRIRLEKPGFVCECYLAPGSQWIIVETFNASHSFSHEYRVVDRAGRQRDLFSVPGSAGTWSVMRADALWMQLWTRGFPIIRVPFNARNGRYAGAADTVLATAAAGFDVTADGTTITYSDGTNQYGLWALELSEAVKGRLLPQRRLVSGTSEIGGSISPDGSRVLVVRSVATEAGQASAIAILPFAGGPAVVHRPSGTLLGSRWVPDGSGVTYAERVSGRVQFVMVDPLTGNRQGVVSTQDSSMTLYTPLNGGWAWAPSYDRLRVWFAGEPRPRELARLGKEELVYDVAAASDRPWLASMSVNAEQDSAFLDVTVLPAGLPARWATFKASTRFPGMSWLADGTLVVWNQETETTTTLYRVRGPARVERFGTIPHQLENFSIALDGHRVVLVTNDFRGDVWLAHLARAGGRR